MTVVLPRLLRASLLAVLLLAGLGVAGAVEPGGMAPEAGGVVLKGPEGITLSRLRGRVVVLDFWASWCGPCRKTLPELNALRKELHAAGHAERFEVLGVGLDQDVKLARRFLERTPVDYPVVVDQIGIATKLYKLWRLPATFVIEPDGRIHYIYWGYGENSTADLKARLLALLARM